MQESPKLLTNIEVLELLKQRPKKESSSKEPFRHSDWIQSQVVQYLLSTPCTKLDSTRRQELQSILLSNKKTSTSGRTGYDLTEAESLQVVNFMPTEPVEIHLMIEDLHTRMSEKEQKELLECISSYVLDYAKQERPAHEDAIDISTTVKEEFDQLLEDHY